MIHLRLEIQQSLFLSLSSLPSTPNLEKNYSSSRLTFSMKHILLFSYSPHLEFPDKIQDSQLNLNFR